MINSFFLSGDYSGGADPGSVVFRGAGRGHRRDTLLWLRSSSLREVNRRARGLRGRDLHSGRNVWGCHFQSYQTNSGSSRVRMENDSGPAVFQMSEHFSDWELMLGCVVCDAVAWTSDVSKIKAHIVAPFAFFFRKIHESSTSLWVLRAPGRGRILVGNIPSATIDRLAKSPPTGFFFRPTAT